jgi:hypothetical protein
MGAIWTGGCLEKQFKHSSAVIPSDFVARYLPCLAVPAEQRARFLIKKRLLGNSRSSERQYGCSKVYPIVPSSYRTTLQAVRPSSAKQTGLSRGKGQQLIFSDVAEDAAHEQPV